MLADGALAYAGVFLAAAIEGEVVFVAASIAVAAGRLNGWSVFLAGALGGAAGDQFFFYAFRGPLSRWLERFPRLTRRRDALAGLVRRYAVALAASSRLLPGLRIAIPVACAYAKVPPLLFSVLNGISALVWSASILGLIAWAGPAALTRLGIGGRAALIVPALAVLLVFLALRRVTFEDRGVPRDPAP
jgi:membrane protein DedA with SNARE-associated domain